MDMLWMAPSTRDKNDVLNPVLHVNQQEDRLQD